MLTERARRYLATLKRRPALSDPGAIWRTASTSRPPATNSTPTWWETASPPCWTAFRTGWSR